MKTPPSGRFRPAAGNKKNEEKNASNFFSDSLLYGVARAHTHIHTHTHTHTGMAKCNLAPVGLDMYPPPPSSYDKYPPPHATYPFPHRHGQVQPPGVLDSGGLLRLCCQEQGVAIVLLMCCYCVLRRCCYCVANVLLLCVAKVLLLCC